MPVLSRDNAIRATVWLEDGMSQNDVALRLGVHQSTISRLQKKLRETGNVARRRGQGRKRVSSAADDRFLQLNSLRNRTLTAPELQNHLETVRGVRISERTVRRRLTEANLKARRPAMCPILNRRHRTTRLAFAREHVNWTIQDWEKVLFTDESRFSLKGADGRQRVWRRTGERYADCAITERDRFGGGSIMVWGGIALDGVTDLVVFDRPSVTAHSYIEDVLQDHVVPFAFGIGPNFVLMQDNARAHVARVTREYLNEVHITVMDWPACSPDLNPIEHLWDELKRRLHAQRPRPASLNELRQFLQEEWRNLQQDVIRNLISSMPRRLQAVIQARGGHTRY